MSASNSTASTGRTPGAAAHRPGAGAGRIEQIWLKRAKGGPMDAVAAARAVAHRGLEGNANQGGKRQVTLLSADVWEAVADQLGRDLDPRTRRANLYLRGVDLTESRGRILLVGTCRLRIWGETKPCRSLEEQVPGLVAALARSWRGGAYGELLDDGEIAAGDPVRWADEG